jgi:hypothetical protein
MPDYSKSIIYTIRSRDNVYVGSTIDFRSRKKQHKGCIYNENGKYYNLKLYKTIRENNYEWVMRPYSKYPCKDKLELTIEEERIRQLLKADLNMYVCACGCSTKKEYQKQYREEHKDENKEYIKQYYEEHKDEIDEYRKQYREENKNKISEQKKQWYEQHKDKISEKALQKVTCECGCVVTKGNLTRHRKSKNHINLMEKLNQ